MIKRSNSWAVKGERFITYEPLTLLEQFLICGKDHKNVPMFRTNYDMCNA